MIRGVPTGAFLRSVLLRSVLVWAFMRAMLAAASAGVAAAGVEVDPGPAAIVPIMAVVLAVVVGDQYRRGEVPFLRSLGIGRTGVLLPPLLVAAACELVLILTGAV